MAYMKLRSGGLEMKATNVVEMPKPKRRTARFKFTDAAVRDLALQGVDEKLPALYHDEELKGFFILCHKGTKGYYVQRDIAGKSVVVHLGATNLMTARDARAKAAKTLLLMKEGVNPNEEKREAARASVTKAETEGFTLRDAVEFHMGRKRERSEKTLLEYRRIFNTHLNGFMDKSLQWLGEHQEEIEKLHDDITNNGWDTGTKRVRGWRKRKPAPYAANGMVRAFRAVYNYARKKKKHLNLPEFCLDDLNPEAPKDCSMTLDQLPLWYAEVQKMHPIHRDFNLFALFTGNRATATREMRWEDVDLTGEKNGVPSVFVPTPKGGRTKAFFIPLSDYLIELLKTRRACGITLSDFPKSQWVFPSNDSDSGHVEDPTCVVFRDAIRAEDGTLKDDVVSPHDLRHTFSTLAHFAEVDTTDIAFLMNQRAKSITVKYMKALLPPLREKQQAITDYIRQLLAKK